MKLSDLSTDPQNANRGTERGAYLLESSLSRYGAGRSILVDKHGVVIAGNKTLEGWAALGEDGIEVVKTDGRRLVVVQRDDLDLSTDPEAKGLAIADNRASEVGLEWEPNVLAGLQETVDLSAFFLPDELQKLLASAEVPDFEPTDLDDQAALDSERMVTCPECGHEFHPAAG